MLKLFTVRALCCYLYVLPYPIQLSVTVTPGLPPLLTNESSRCQFTDREGQRMITVDAEEVTPNTAYQCNITGRIPIFTGVQLGKMYYCSCVFELLQHIRLLTYH